ncbi:MAG: hypothetical protein Q7S27_01305 [Nanoarchaeota archaeon]|nr:hypothetical protein [Nanoarchaeota archaeon]
MKKEGMKNSLMKGILIGSISVLILFLAFYFLIGIRNSGDKVLIGKEEVVFSLKEVHKTVNLDFAGGTIPIYDSGFCMKKYLEKYNEDAEQCEIRSIQTLARLNPLVVNVDCVCFK